MCTQYQIGSCGAVNFGAPSPCSCCTFINEIYLWYENPQPWVAIQPLKQRKWSFIRNGYADLLRQIFVPVCKNTGIFVPATQPEYFARIFVPMTPNHLLRIQCPDQPGLIASITSVLFSRGLNIVVMKEFVEPVSNLFFARLEISGTLDAAETVQEMRSGLPPNAIVTLQPEHPKKIVIMVTKEHHCLSDLLVRHHFNELNAQILAVIGNYDSLQNFTEKFGIPFIYISHEGKDKATFEQEMLQVLARLQPDYVVLAKFMRILSPQFVEAWQTRIINIHHSFLPAFVGANPYRQAYERGVKLIGATAHIVTNDLDEGPIITQKVIAADHEYDAAGMIKAGHEVEKNVLADALRHVFDDRVFVLRNRTIIFD